MSQTLKAAKTKTAWTTLIWLWYIYSILGPNCVLQRTAGLWNATDHHCARRGFASGIDQSCETSWVVLCISFLTSAEHGLHMAMCWGQTKACPMAQPNPHPESHPSLVFSHRNPSCWWKGTWTKLFGDGNLHVVVSSLKSQDWCWRSTWHARLHLKSIEAIFWAHKVL